MDMRSSMVMPQPAAHQERATPEERLLLEVGMLRDPLGVLSIYVDADPTRAAAPRPGWDLRLRGELGVLQHRLERIGREDRAAALRARVTELDDDLTQILHPSAPGRGRALFAPLGGGEPQRFALQLPLPDYVGVAEAAHMRPLLEAFEAGRPAGVVSVSRAGVRVLDIRLGVAEDVLWLDGHRMPFMQSAAGRIAELASERGWSVVLLRGDPRRTEPLRRQIIAGDPRLPVETAAGSLEWRSEEELAAAVAADLARVRRIRDWALVKELRDEALGGAAATLGLDATARALDEERVALLLLGDVPDRLADPITKRALETGARVAPLAVEATAGLEPYAGIAARLRW